VFEAIPEKSVVCEGQRQTPEKRSLSFRKRMKTRRRGEKCNGVVGNLKLACFFCFFFVGEGRPRVRSEVQKKGVGDPRSTQKKNPSLSRRRGERGRRAQ